MNKKGIKKAAPGGAASEERSMKPYFGLKRLKDISDVNIKEYISDEIKKGLSASTIRKHFYVLSLILQDAVKQKNPCIGIKLPKIVKYDPAILEEAEFDLFRAAFKNTVDELPLLLAGLCGLRIGEICALKWNDIDKKNGIITVDENRAISEYGYIDVEPKSTRGIRNIPVSGTIMELLAKKKVKQKIITEYIFPITPSGCGRRFHKLILWHNSKFKLIKEGKAHKEDFKLSNKSRCTETNIADAPLPMIRFHDLRHYHASILYKQGFSDIYAAERLGHDIIVLKKIYQHLEKSVKIELDNKAKAIFI